MRLRHVLLLIGLVGATGSVVAAPVDEAAERDYAAFRSLQQHPPEASPKEPAQLRALAEHNRQLREAGLSFYRRHPADPRRWEIVTTLAAQPPYLMRSTGDAAVFDEVAWRAWREQLDVLQRALLASADATATQREAADWLFFEREFQSVNDIPVQDRRAAFTRWQARFEAHLANYAGEATLVDRAHFFLTVLDAFEFGASVDLWRRLLAGPDAALRARAAERLAEIEALRRPQEMAFTALDGRAVDLAKLRGKVVLLDFWATWCGPCVAELPEVKKVYAAYRDRGFEVIGITLENARLAPGDTPAQASAKLDRCRQKLVDFVAKNDLPWPQYFDGRYVKGEFVERYGVYGIPATFLLDREGRVVAVDLRGPALEQAVARQIERK